MIISSRPYMNIAHAILRHTVEYINQAVID